MKYLAMLLLTGCAGMEPGQYSNFWTQCVKTQAYGITYYSTYGPVNLGYITWERNLQCKP